MFGCGVVDEANMARMEVTVVFHLSLSFWSSSSKAHTALLGCAGEELSRRGYLPSVGIVGTQAPTALAADVTLFLPVHAC